LAIVNRNAPDVWTIAEPQTIAVAIAYSGVGALLAARRPGNAIGWLFLAMGLVGALVALAFHWAIYGLVTQPGAPGAALALWGGLALASTLLVPTFPLLLFPSGRLPDRRTRIVTVLAALATVALAFSLITGDFAPPGFPELYERTPNPLALDEPVGDPGLAVMAQLLLGLIAIGLLLARFRAARGIARQQYRWVVLAMGLVIVASLADFVVRAAGTSWYVVTSPALSLAFMLVPVAMGIAILRYHLWDFDVVISRTLVYLALSGCVVGIYVFVVGWLGAAFRTGGNLVFSLIATAIVAVLFQPLRERIQRGVNRLLYGERDEPYAVISRLGRRLEESLAPEAMLPVITGTVRDALKLPYSAIALLQGGEPVVVAATGQPVPDPVRVPLVYQHEPIGELLLAPRAPGETFSPADRRLMDDLARQAGIAVHAVQLTIDLQQARERLVEAREEERRRLRRDLHDGLGSQLAALNLQAGALRGLIDTDPLTAQAEVVELRTQLRDAIASIRTLVHGLRPPAIDELACSSRCASGCGNTEPTASLSRPPCPTRSRNCRPPSKLPSTASSKRH
jgi:signal transduction histidine kinase